jgi:hypothetical protein
LKERPAADLVYQIVILQIINVTPLMHLQIPRFIWYQNCTRFRQRVQRVPNALRWVCAHEKRQAIG